MTPIYDSPTQVKILTEEDELINEELLPGFRCRIRDLFKQPKRLITSPAE